MSNVNELLERVKTAMKQKNIPGIRDEESELEPGKEVRAYIQPRRNGTPDNVSVTIEIIEWKRYVGSCFTGKRLFRVNVPKDASDRAISNRLDKVLKELGC